MDNFIEEIDKEDKDQHMKMKKKALSKPKPEQPLPRNQPTLFQFSAKKQSKWYNITYMIHLKQFIIGYCYLNFTFEISLPTIKLIDPRC